MMREERESETAHNASLSNREVLPTAVTRYWDRRNVRLILCHYRRPR